jgi:LytS/YehU family sensor histidine kinase
VIVSAGVSEERERFLEIVVRNSGAPLGSRSSTASSGIGLQNVAHRLRCYYGDEATLRLSSDASGETVAEVRIPLQTVAGEEETPTLVEHLRS